MAFAPLDTDTVQTNLAIANEKPKYANLLQELIYALLGITGDVFVDDLENVTPQYGFHAPSQCSYHISTDISWLNASDCKLIDEILKTGFHYKQIERFVRDQQSCANTISSNVCWLAFANGLDELCTVFHSAVLRVQQHVISDACPVLSSMQHFLSEYTVVMAAVHTVLWQLVTLPGATSQNSTACLDLLFERSRCGVPALKTVIERLLWHCNQLLYQHLSAWMVHGLLLATDFSFFITCSDADSRMPEVDPLSLPEAPLSRDALVVGDPAENEAAWGSFAVQQGRVPKYLPAMAPSRILFIGRAVRLLQRPKSRLSQDQLLPQAQVMAWAADLRQLQAGPIYSSIAFERCINRIHDQVSEALHGLMVREVHLVSHLGALKDFMLLCRGDFFHAFLEEGSDLLRLPPREATASSDLINPFQQAAAKSGVDTHPHFNLISVHWARTKPVLKIGVGFTVRAPSFASAAADQASWDSIQLRYRLQWPLPLLLTPDTMAKYESLFMYILALQRSVLALQSVWLHLMTQSRNSRRFGSSHPAKARRRQQATHIRHRMAHVLGKIYVYLKVDVIEDNYKLLLASLDQSTSFTDVRRAHDSFLSRLIHNTFLTAPAICDKLQTLMQACGQLHSIVCEGADGDLTELDKNFTLDSSILFTMLRSHKLNGLSNGGNHVRQLVLRLNYNLYMDHVCSSFFHSEMSALRVPSSHKPSVPRIALPSDKQEPQEPLPKHP